LGDIRPDPMTVSPRHFLLFAACLALLYAGLGARGLDALIDTPIAEDGWYALTIARNVAAGQGVTIDGVTWTNGFQPLFTFLQAGGFLLAGGDTIWGLRVFYGLAALVHVAGAILVACLARDHAAREKDLVAALAGLGYLAAIKAYNDFYTGLETGLQLALYALVWRLHAQDWRGGWRREALLGAALGLLVLARIDAAIFVAVLCADELRRGLRSLPDAIRRCLVVGGTSVLVSSPWWLYNALVFGHPMPTSGFAQQETLVSLERTMSAIWALGCVAMPWIFAGAHEGDAFAFARTAALAALVWLALRARWKPAGNLGFAALLLAAYAALVLYYWLTFFADWFYIRYFAPLSLLAFVFVPGLLVQTARKTAAPLASAAGAFAVVLLVLAWTGWSPFGASAHHEQVALVEEHVPADATVAAGQSGTLGFLRNRVVNIDGKVNPEALRWRGRMTDYLDRRGIEWFADSTWYVELYLGLDPAAAGWRLVAQSRDFVVYRRVRG
jgi:hypothetical protein